MTLPCEVTVTIREDELAMKEKFLVYDPFCISREDITINEVIRIVLDKFKSNPVDPKIKVKITFEI